MVVHGRNMSLGMNDFKEFFNFSSEFNQTYAHKIDGMTDFTKDVSLTTEDGVPIRKLFISNLAERTTYKDLNNLFSKYGQVDSCFLRRNQGKSNYAFVTFNNVSDAGRARVKKLELHNRCLRVMPADSWHQPDNLENQYYNTAKEWHKLEKKQSMEQCNTNCIEYEMENNSINRLNDDCLMHIFLHLPIVDRIRIESVCKRWRAVGQESWRSVKRLDLSSSTWGFRSIAQTCEINTIMLRKVLLRCGRFLTEIDLSGQTHRLCQSTLSIVAKLCPNLQRINVTALTVSTSGINSLVNNCQSITHFTLGRTVHMCDTDLQNLFEVNRKLKYFNAASTNITGKCLLHLPSEMQEIVLEQCVCVDHFLPEAFAKFTNLESLRIKRCYNIYGSVLTAISTYCTNLRILELIDGLSMLEPLDMLAITQLANLEVLKVCFSKAVTSDFFSILSTKCRKLVYLDITGCASITNSCLSAIATLPKLEVLIMNQLYNVEDSDLRDMFNLRKLECQECQFSDETISNLIKCSQRLELLDLSGCTFITTETLKTAAAVTLNRTNNTILKIYIGRTSVDLDKFNDVSPFLQIVNVDLSPPVIEILAASINTLLFENLRKNDIESVVSG